MGDGRWMDACCGGRMERCRRMESGTEELGVLSLPEWGGCGWKRYHKSTTTQGGECPPAAKGERHLSRSFTRQKGPSIKTILTHPKIPPVRPHPVSQCICMYLLTPTCSVHPIAPARMPDALNACAKKNTYHTNCSSGLHHQGVAPRGGSQQSNNKR